MMLRFTKISSPDCQLHAGVGDKLITPIFSRGFIYSMVRIPYKLTGGMTTPPIPFWTKELINPNGHIVLELQSQPVFNGWKWMFPKMDGTSKWMVKIMENPIKIDDLGVPSFLETPKWLITPFFYVKVLVHHPTVPVPSNFFETWM